MNPTVDLPNVVSREQWREERVALLEKEKQLTRLKDELSAERRRLPMVKVETDYEFEGQEGGASLPDLFEGRRQLIIYHFMFDPSWEKGCPSCTKVINNFAGLSVLHKRQTTFALVSRAPFQKLESYRAEMGWDLPWYSSFGSDFNYDFHTTLDPAVTPVENNYRSLDLPDDMFPLEAHALSVFLRDGQEVYHTYSTFARGVDSLLTSYNYLDLTPLGRQDG